MCFAMLREVDAVDRPDLRREVDLPHIMCKRVDCLTVRHCTSIIITNQNVVCLDTYQIMLPINRSVCEYFGRFPGKRLHSQNPDLPLRKLFKMAALDEGGDVQSFVRHCVCVQPTVRRRSTLW